MVMAVPGAVSLIGCGVIGRGWIRVFASSRVKVRLYDASAATCDRAIDWLEQDLAADISDGFIAKAERDIVLAHVEVAPGITDALSGVEYVQESIPEVLELKQELFRQLDSIAAPNVILASSTSALDISLIAQGLSGARRCVMAHPFNPPHLLPVVEVLGTTQTDPAIVQRACSILAACGQLPVRMNRYVRGFLGNRIQAAVVREALHLVETGVADPIAVDAVIRDALALRWATIGNFGANHTNADSGIAEYFRLYGDAYREMMADLDSTPPRFAMDVLEGIGRAVEQREHVPDTAALRRKRDVMLKKLARLKREQEQQS
jgi:3-hydroxyacyl-CoA dehydrogenase